MCCTTSTGSGKFAGSAPSSLASAGGPPVEAATAEDGRGLPSGASTGAAWALAHAPPPHQKATGRRRITGTSP